MKVKNKQQLWNNTSFSWHSTTANNSDFLLLLLNAVPHHTCTASHHNINARKNKKWGMRVWEVVGRWGSRIQTTPFLWNIFSGTD